MALGKIIEQLEKKTNDPVKGLPEELFQFVSRLTPLVNVDLLIKNHQGRTLLTWRDDGFWPAGWHVPGGIVRYKEPFAQRIKATAQNELGARIVFKAVPLAVNECIIKSRKTRGHFISFLYKCRLLTRPKPSLQCRDRLRPKNGEWLWHETCPKNILEVHKMYRDFI